MSKKIIKSVVIFSAFIGAAALSSVLIFNSVRQMIIEDNEVLAHTVAQSILPALLANDKSQVDAILKGLENYPGIQVAELLSAEGASIASYAKSGAVLDPTNSQFELASAPDDLNEVRVMAPITFDSVIVANLSMAVNLWPTYIRIITWMGLLLAIPSVIYVLIKRFGIKLRFERVTDHDAEGGGGMFNVASAVGAAMNNADITIEYQSIQRMSDGGLFGMEVVVCWRHPSGQTLHVSPSDFVGLAEREGICLPFDDWLLTTACTCAAKWQHQYGPLILSINVSAKQFKDPLFAEKVRRACDHSQYPHQLLELEVNESVVARDLNTARTCLKNFTDHGLTVTLDSFGLLHGSYDLLGNIPVHKVKLDRKLIARMGSDEPIARLIQGTIDHALSQEVQVMVDGLAHAEQRISLQRMGCILGQGTYFNPPMSASNFESFLSARPFDMSTFSRSALLGNVNNSRSFKTV